MSCPHCGVKGKFKFCPGCGADCSQKAVDPMQALASAASTVQRVGSVAQRVGQLAAGAAAPPTWSVVVGEVLPSAAELLAQIAAQQANQVVNQVVHQVVNQTRAEKSPAPPPPPAGAVHCSLCAAAFRPGARFCAKCGGPAAAAVCPGCGLARDGKSRFCGHCGIKVD